jgi:hypothetical protein
MKKWILLIPLLAVLFNWERINEAFIPPESIPGIGPGEVVLYATAWCGYCEQTRRFLRARKVPFVEHDIEHSEAARREFEALGAMHRLMLRNDRLGVVAARHIAQPSLAAGRPSSPIRQDSAKTGPRRI